MKELIKKYFPDISEKQAGQLETYYELLIEWNEKVNLTAISEKGEVAAKHFADSALPLSEIERGASLIDVGTGAGFPGVVIKILRPDVKLTLLDSLNKRIVFLKELCDKLGLSDVECIHARAEDGAREARLRESFDMATARAVASAPFLAEWLTPYLKIGGKALLYKGPQAEEELKLAESALKKLKLEARLIKYPECEWGERNIIVLEKKGKTDKAYPRKAGAKTAL